MRPIGLAVILALRLTLAPLAAEAQPAGKAPQVAVLLLDTEALGLSTARPQRRRGLAGARLDRRLEYRAAIQVRGSERSAA